jgi:hypothetical protein
MIIHPREKKNAKRGGKGQGEEPTAALHERRHLVGAAMVNKDLALAHLGQVVDAMLDRNGMWYVDVGDWFDRENRSAKWSVGWQICSRLVRGHGKIEIGCSENRD